MKTLRQTLLVVAAFCAAAANSQEPVRSSSSLYLPAFSKADVTIPFAFSSEGKRFNPTWGLDQAWVSKGNLQKGINHMGKENIGIGRTAYRYTQALTNDSVLGQADINYLRNRSNIFNEVDPKLPLVFTADQEAVSSGPPEYYVKNKSCNIEHWAAMINSNVHWMQVNTSHPIVGISPFNEPDYWTVEEGASVEKQWQLAKMLKENYPRCKDIAMVGGNTLNNDKALEWYTSGKAYYDWGNTHQLAGSFDNFVNFYQQLKKDGKVGYADEMHNVGEAMIGLEYGMTVGIWWGFDSRARGEFCQISRHGSRLAYGENRSKWTAASVYRHDDGRVKAFIGSSERQANTSTYQFVSPERLVYYDGYGPVYEYFSQLPGGTGYKVGQTNAERVIDVTWGEDVAPGVIDGTYKIVNKVSGVTGNVVAYNSSGSNIVQQAYKGTAKQQWTVKPVTNRTGGDLSFYDIESVDNPNIHMNVKDYSKSQADVIAWSQNLPTSNEQWYLEYAGNGYYYVRCRESALYLATAGTSTSAKIIQRAWSETDKDRMMFRFLPLNVTYETVVPAKPQGLVAESQPASVKLSWTANSEEDLEGYMVVRSEKGKSDWNTIARKLTENYFIDNTCRPGVSYIYKVKAIDLAQNLSEASETAEATATGERALIAQWDFDGNFYDSTINMMDAAINGTARFLDDHKTGTKSLNCVLQFVQLPYAVANSDELTIGMWVNWRSSTTQWQRIFDFGNDSEHYMFLTPYNSYTNKMRFAIKNGGDEQWLDCPTKLSAYSWKHVTVTIGKDRTVIYIDGVEVASSNSITIKPSDIRPVLNYLGRSQFNSDPLLSAYIDDMRIYNYALSADEVKLIMSGDDPLAIHQPKANQQPSQIFGVNGVQRQAVQSGLNIIDGRKVVVK